MRIESHYAISIDNLVLYKILFHSLPTPIETGGNFLTRDFGTAPCRLVRGALHTVPLQVFS